MLFVLSFLRASPAQAQESTSLAREEQFTIPNKNSTISFATNGTYQKASFENNVWSFKNLRLGSSQSNEEINLKVSAQDCAIRIATCQIFHGPFIGYPVLTARIRYSIIGNGAQTFNLDLDPTEGDWNVIVNGEYRGENIDWQVSSDYTLMIKNASGDVNLIYYGYPQSYIESQSSDFLLDNHSVSIIVAVALVIFILLSAIVMARARRGRTMRAEEDNTNVRW
jgi:hypothetical protein